MTMEEYPSRDDLESMIAAGLAEYDDAVRARWNKIRIEPEKWRSGESSSFWVVAIEGNRALWFDDVEDGFTWSIFIERGTLDESTCNQDEFTSVLERFAQEISENARARLDEGNAPREAAPGTIVARRTTYWDIRSTRGITYRIHFRDSLETKFADPSYPSIVLADRHPLLGRYEEPMRSLYFFGAPSDPGELAKAADRAIREASDSWRGLDDYTSLDAAAKLLAGKHGMLMYAPASTCDAVARVLEAGGVRCSILGEAPARPGPCVLLLGCSFVIASGFAFEPIGGYLDPS